MAKKARVKADFGRAALLCKALLPAHLVGRVQRMGTCLVFSGRDFDARRFHAWAEDYGAKRVTWAR